MSLLLTPATVWNAVDWYMNGMLRGDTNSYAKYQILDSSIKWIWMAAPWRGTVGELANIPMFDNQCDYNINSTPARFLKLQHVYWTNGQNVKHIEVVDFITSAALIKGPMQYSQFVAGTPNKIRLYPTPGTGMTNANTLVSLYKLTAPTISSGNFSTAGAFEIDDEWQPVIFAFALAYAMVACHDARGSTAQWDEASRSYKFGGQWAQAEAMMEAMRKREALAMEWDYQPDVKAGRR